MARNDPQINFRLSDELKARLETAAKANNRTLTAEIKFLLEWALDFFERERAMVPITDDDDRGISEKTDTLLLRDIMAELAGLRAELVNTREGGDRPEVNYSREKRQGVDER